MQNEQQSLEDYIYSFFSERVTLIQELTSYMDMGVETKTFLANIFVYFVASFEVMIDGFEDFYGGSNARVDKEIGKMRDTMRWMKMLLLHPDSNFPIDAETLLAWKRGEGRPADEEDVRHMLHIVHQFSDSYVSIFELKRLVYREGDQLPSTFFSAVALMHFMGQKTDGCECEEYQQMLDRGVDFHAIDRKAEEFIEMLGDPSDFVDEHVDKELSSKDTSELRGDTVDVINGTRIWQN